MQVNWQSLGGGQFLPPEFLNPGEQRLAVGTNLDGRLEIFAAVGAVWHLWQTAPNGPWAPPAKWDFARAAAGRLAVAGPLIGG